MRGGDRGRRRAGLEGRGGWHCAAPREGRKCCSLCSCVPVYTIATTTTTPAS
ncbi:hypothetical protein E2C01_081949 [Portunus trituberculatus]|uniref:Uncharacterized protein n=1 Tax=Portunus trituberculatus TaxID=210409 RepID=A0A5B7J2G9_PORTR|nr:hypothetical protein [Portunus trituberculatus]